MVPVLQHTITAGSGTGTTGSGSGTDAAATPATATRDLDECLMGSRSGGSGPCINQERHSILLYCSKLCREVYVNLTWDTFKSIDAFLCFRKKNLFTPTSNFLLYLFQNKSIDQQHSLMVSIMMDFFY